MKLSCISVVQIYFLLWDTVISVILCLTTFHLEFLIKRLTQPIFFHSSNWSLGHIKIWKLKTKKKKKEMHVETFIVPKINQVQIYNNQRPFCPAKKSCTRVVKNLAPLNQVPVIPNLITKLVYLVRVFVSNEDNSMCENH